MSEIFINSSGSLQQYLNGNLVDDINFDSDYDGDVMDLELQHNNQEYYTQLDKEALIALVNCHPHSKPIFLRLSHRFPFKKTRITKTKKRSKENKNKSKKNKSKK